MHDKHHEDLARISAESHDHVMSACASCESTRQHIEKSRKLIARSIELLGQPFDRFGR